jgi:hypothetical protein
MHQLKHAANTDQPQRRLMPAMHMANADVLAVAVAMHQLGCAGCLQIKVREGAGPGDRPRQLLGAQCMRCSARLHWWRVRQCMLPK